MTTATSRTLNIGISARVLDHPVGGVREYTIALTDALLSLQIPHRFSIYYGDRKWLGTFPAAREVVLQAPHKLAWDHWVLPRGLARDRPDVIWFPHNVVSAGLGIPAVVSVMDMLYFPVPEYPLREYALADTMYMRLFIPPSLRVARRIMAISDWTARDIVRLLGVPRQRIQVIYLAASPEFRPLPAHERHAVREKYGLLAPYFLYVGGFYRRKNIPTLLEAFACVQHQVPQDLVLVGGSNSVEIPLEPHIARFGIGRRVRRLGAVPKADLVALYNAADAFVFPSRYEGFGLPVVEAFACGCPVITSHATSLAEVAGDAALVFDPNDSNALAAHMITLASDPQQRFMLASAGLERATQFSYARAARELVTLLETAAA